MIKAVLNFDASRHQVFSVLTDFPRYTEWVPGCERCTVVTRSGSVVETEIVVNSMRRMEMRLQFDAQPLQIIKFHMTKGKDLKAYSGTYRFMDAASGRGTVVVAELAIDAGFMVPRFMVDKIAGKLMEETGNALKQQLQKMPLTTIPLAQPPPSTGELGLRRPRRILRVVKTASGYRLWLQGQIFDVPNPVQ